MPSTRRTTPVRVAFAGNFAARFVDRVRPRLQSPCELILVAENDGDVRLDEVDVLVSMVFTSIMAAAAKRLKLVQVPGAGLDRIDQSAVPPGARLANAYGHEVGIAEYVMGVMLGFTRDFVRLDARLRQGIWESQWAIDTPGPPPYPELAGKTLGILGYGRIGRALARRAQAFDMRVWATRRKPGNADAEGLDFLGGPDKLDEVLQAADYLAITLALTESTRGLIGERELRLMKPTAVLINVARGEIVEEVPLYQALTQRWIAGAAVDVWYRYPTQPGATLPSRQPFHELTNLLMTPHVSGWTEGMMEARAQVIAENIERTARGEPPLNMVR